METETLEVRLERTEAEHRAKNIALMNRLIGILHNNGALAHELRRALGL
jgi:hypothetical protein